MVAITKGALVRFTTKVTRYVRDHRFVQTNEQHTVPQGTVGICLGEGEATFGAGRVAQHEKRPVIFTALGFRICEHPDNLEVLSGPPSEVTCQL